MRCRALLVPYRCHAANEGCHIGESTIRPTGFLPEVVAPRPTFALHGSFDPSELVKRPKLPSLLHANEVCFLETGRIVPPTVRISRLHLLHARGNPLGLL